MVESNLAIVGLNSYEEYDVVVIMHIQVCEYSACE